MSFGWMFDGLDSASAGFSVLDSFVCAAGAAINKSYASDVLRYANHIGLFITPAGGTADHELYAYPTLAAALGGSGSASVTGTGGSTAFLVLVFIR